MPKVTWGAADADQLLTADDIDGAEDSSFEPYAGDLPPGGVYRWTVKKISRATFGTNNQGLKVLLILDGSWKEAHAKYDGFPMFDNVVLTKASAAFVKAFALAYGVTAADIINSVVTDEQGVVTKIGKKTVNGEQMIYANTKRGSYNDEPKLEKAGTGYLVVEKIPGGDTTAKKTVATPAKKAAAAAEPAPEKAGKKAKGKKSKAELEEEPPF